MILRTYENDKAIIPDEMEPSLSKYDVEDDISGTIVFTVDSKDAKQVTICIETFSCNMNKQEIKKKS